MNLFRAGRALIVVDVQNDFLPSGSLGVPQGDRVIPALNRYIELALQAAAPIFATRDWHPSDHCSFRTRGGPWPPHCVAGTAGAEFASALRLPGSVTIISKGQNRDRDAYSGFDGTDLETRLRSSGVGSVVVGGLATDYCVLSTVRDARDKGFQVHLLMDAIRPVDVHPGDGFRAEQEMIRLGAQPMLLPMLQNGTVERSASH